MHELLIMALNYRKKKKMNRNYMALFFCTRPQSTLLSPLVHPCTHSYDNVWLLPRQALPGQSFKKAGLQPATPLSHSHPALVYMPCVLHWLGVNVYGSALNKASGTFVFVPGAYFCSRAVTEADVHHRFTFFFFAFVDN